MPDGVSQTGPSPDETPLHAEAAFDDYDDDIEWFGEGSAFDSGEDLAAALLQLAGVSAKPQRDAAPAGWDLPQAPAPPVRSAPRPGGGGAAIETEIFQTFERPRVQTSPGLAPAKTRFVPRGPVRANWSVRHSGQFLRATEEVVAGLQEQAIQRAWDEVAKAIAYAQPYARKPDKAVAI